MKSHPVIFRGRSSLDIAGLFAVLILFVANAFHYNIHSTYVYYRELFGVLFLALIALHFLKKSTTALDGALRLGQPLLYLLLFPVALLIWSGLDTGEPLYSDRHASKSSEHLLGASHMMLTIYVLRNALLYLPLVVYLFLRGLNTQEIRLVALTAIVVAPFSITGYLQIGEFSEMEMTLGGVAELGGNGIAYNSFVPYLTFHVLCGAYLLFSPGRRLIKGVALGCIVYTTLFILFSTSRQSTLFILILFIVFYFVQDRKGSRKNYDRQISTGLGILAMGVIYAIVTKNVELPETFVRRFGSLQGFISNDARIMTVKYGFSLLSPGEWFTGAGLTCVTWSGPHNDYVRWAQRIGIPLMIVGFLPFLITFIRSVRLIRFCHGDRSLYVFLLLVVSFTLFHSLFGYPREEAYQAVAVYLGIAIWFGAYRERLRLNSRRSTKMAQLKWSRSPEPQAEKARMEPDA